MDKVVKTAFLCVDEDLVVLDQQINHCRDKCERTEDKLRVTEGKIKVLEEYLKS